MIFEIVNLNTMPGRLRVALFDFDGTVSLLRLGWQQIMIQLMTELVPRLDGEGESEISRMAGDLVYRTNGQPTLYQMRALADLMRERGGTPLEAIDYKVLFLDRLSSRVRPRLAAIESHSVGPEAWQVPGVGRMLDLLRARGMPCYLASGTDQSAVRSETSALELAQYFEAIYGATAETEDSTKAAIIKRLVLRHNLEVNELVTFGDGVEEIRLTKQVGGIAVGIARADEDPESIDPVQRERLIASGADLIIGDFRVQDQIMRYLFERPS
jgi:phosphoglycolate phosphatase